MPAEALQPITDSKLSTLKEAVRRYHSAAFLAEEWFDARGVSEESRNTFRLGLCEDPIPGHEQYEGMICIPYLDSIGRVLKVRFRRLSGDGPKYMDLSHEHSRMFNTKAILNADREIHVTEGECLTGDAEVLTPEGWVRFDAYAGQDVMQYNPDGTLSLVTPEAFVVNDYDGELVEYSNSQRFYSLTTPGHRMPAMGGKREPWRFVEAATPAPFCCHIPRAGIATGGSGTGWSDDEKALALALSADASIRKSSDGWKHGPGGVYAVFGLKKQRKIERLTGILDRLGVEYSCNLIKGGYTSICFHLRGEYRQFGRMLDHSWLTSATEAEREFMLEELVHWDGNRVPSRDQTEYSSKYEQNAVWVQTLAHLSGRTSTIIRRENKFGRWCKVSILHAKGTTSWQSLQNPVKVPYSGKVYCVKVPSSAFLVRQGGCITVTGNCDAIILEQLGYHAVALPGATQWQKHHPKMLAGFERIYAWGDPDSAGAEFNERILTSMRQAQAVKLAEDVNDTYLSGGAEAIEEAIKKVIW